MRERRAATTMMALALLLAGCGGKVTEPGPADLGPACDPKNAAACPVRNDCRICVNVGASGQCGTGCRSAADCGAGLSCRKTHAYSYTGGCTAWTEDPGYCAQPHDPFGSLCAVPDDCESTASGCAICGQAKGEAAYRCRKKCGGDADCTAPQKCVAPAATSAFSSSEKCGPVDRWCE